MLKILKGTLLTAMLFMLAGCVSSRGLKINLSAESIVKPNGMQVYIRQITDEREFQARPGSPSIPSFGSKKDIGNPAIKCRTIGRQRNGYGKAMRNVFLEETQKVEALTFEALRNALVALGYEVVDSKEKARQDAIIMDVKIDKFWSWVNIGAWTLRIDADIETTITLGSGKQLIIAGDAQNHCQAGSSANWRKSIKLALEDYVQQAKEKLKCLPDNC
jgi:hypothetical protein